jgi:hypothetical protein
VAVALGEPKHAKRYCGELAPNSTCLVQKDESPYAIYGLKRGGLGSWVNFDLMKAGKRASDAGFKQDKPVGDVMMLPGTFIVDKMGVIQFAHYGQHAGDHPDMKNLLTVGQTLKG